MKRHVLVVAYAYPPSPGVGGTRWEAMAESLVGLGHSVTVVASGAWGALPDDAVRNVIRVNDLRAAKPLRRLLGRGTLRREGEDSVPRSPSALLTRVFVPELYVATWLPQLVVTLRRHLARRHFDCLVTSSPPESTHLAGLLLGDVRPAWICDFRDGWTFEPYREPFPTAAQRAVDSWLEQRVARTADFAVAVTPPIVDDLRRRMGMRAEWVTNGWLPSTTRKAASPVSEMRGPTLVYTGTLSGPWGRDPTPLFRALRKVQLEGHSPPVRLVHAGPLTTEERALIDRTGAIELVDHVGNLPRAEALALQGSADALVLITSSNRSEATGKLFEYLFSGRPILALAERNEAARIIEETGTGVAVPSRDVDAIAAALRRFASGELSRTYAPKGLERYAYPAPAKAMAACVEEAISRATERRDRRERTQPR